MIKLMKDGVIEFNSVKELVEYQKQKVDAKNEISVEKFQNIISNRSKEYNTASTLDYDAVVKYIIDNNAAITTALKKVTGKFITPRYKRIILEKLKEKNYDVSKIRYKKRCKSKFEGKIEEKQNIKIDDEIQLVEDKSTNQLLLQLLKSSIANQCPLTYYNEGRMLGYDTAEQWMMLVNRLDRLSDKIAKYFGVEDNFKIFRSTGTNPYQRFGYEYDKTIEAK